MKPEKQVITTKQGITTNQGITIKQSIRNNLFALRLSWQLSKGYVILIALNTAIDYFLWIFYSAFFMRYVVDAIERKERFEQIFAFILICGGINLICTCYSLFIDNVIRPLYGVKIYQRLYKRLYQKAENVELACFEDSEFYNQYTMAVDDACDKVISIIGSICSIVFGGIAVVTVFQTMYQIDKIAMLFVISPIIGNFLFGAIKNKMIFARYEKCIPFVRKAEYVNRVMCLSDYSKEMRLSKVSKLMEKKFKEAVEGRIKIGASFARKLIPVCWLQFYFTFTIIFEGVLLYGAYRTIVSKTISLGELAVLSSIMVSATWILIGFSNALVESTKNGLFMQKLRTFMEYKEKIPEDYDGIVPENKITSIEFRDVTFSYKDDEPVLKQLNFIIKGGSSVALVGHNGAGKSTIIKLMFRLYDPTSGVILVNGRNIKEYNLKEYRKLFAAAFQDYKIFAMSVRDNVLMGRKPEKEDEAVITALKRAGVYSKIESLPNGVDTVLTREFDKEGVVLSGGEYQKIVVARAFISSAGIKVFDEPSSALDPIAESELFDSILDEGKENTMIFISHRLSSVQNADEVYMLEEGRLIEKGNHKCLMTLNGKYADMYRKQAENYLAVSNYKEVICE
ncbi:MAG: ABC-type multidrug transport system, ATPase and permease component [Herbinix sp.]|nr:ABC-type multidrug transport system, ATPase and permease component [Herbinix sp.]